MKKIIFGLILLVSFYLVSPKFLSAKSVECYTQFGPCPSYIVDALSSVTQVPLLRPLPSSRVKELLSQFPQIRSVALFRRLPSTLVVSIDLRRPIGMVLGTQTGQEFGLVDEEGIIFSTSPGSMNLPLLKISGPITSNSRLSEDQSAAITALHNLSLLNLGQPIGSISSTSLYADLQNGLQIVINLNSPVTSWYSPLQLILDRSKISSKFPKKIDMRFTNPVLTY